MTREGVELAARSINSSYDGRLTVSLTDLEPDGAVVQSSRHDRKYWVRSTVTPLVDEYTTKQ